MFTLTVASVAPRMDSDISKAEKAFLYMIVLTGAKFEVLGRFHGSNRVRGRLALQNYQKPSQVVIVEASNFRDKPMRGKLISEMGCTSFQSTATWRYGVHYVRARCRVVPLQTFRLYTGPTTAFHIHGSTRHQSTQTKTPQLPLSDLKILDLSRVLAGPFCTQILSDYGATVLKIEEPTSGDETRQWRTAGEAQKWKPEYPLMSLYFCAVNRNKRSMTLNLKDERARQIVQRLVEQEGYDIVVHNFLPGKLEKMGLGYEDLKKINPRLIYAAVSGYGATGPSSQRAGYDAIALAEAGLLHITGDSGGSPAKPGVAIADMCTGLYAHGAILAAVNARNNNGGLGTKIESSLFESSLSLLINVGLGSMNLDLDQGPQRRRRGSRLGLGHPSLVPYDGYKTQDGRMIFVAANNNRQWNLFCQKMELDKVSIRFETNDSRVDNRKEITDILNRRFQQKPLQEWLDIFEGSGLPYGPINDVVEALEHPQAQARNMVAEIDGICAARDGMLKLIGPPVKFAEHKPDVRRNPPLLGEHTQEVLTEIGYSQQQVEELKSQGIV